MESKNKLVEFLRKHKSGALEFLRFAIISLLIVIPIRYFIAQPFIVSGESMFPTFHNGEYLIIDELSYFMRSPDRGEVIVFHYPLQHNRYLIKRIIGLPNETVKINNGIVTIKNNVEEKVLSEPYINEKFYTDGTYTLKENEYFVMGDNRNRSSDSRTWGILLKEDIVGRAYLRLIPLHKISYLPGKTNY